MCHVLTDREPTHADGDQLYAIIAQLSKYI